MTRSWLKDCSVKTMSTEEASWLAGFMDGEGSVCLTMAGRNKAHKTWTLSIPNSEIKALEKCAKITGVGKVKQKSRPKKEHHKQMFQWQVQAQRNIKSICEQILPYCAIKQDQINNFLTTWKDI